MGALSTVPVYPFTSPLQLHSPDQSRQEKLQAFPGHTRLQILAHIKLAVRFGIGKITKSAVVFKMPFQFI